jgi:hypothetical protein
MNSPIRDLPSEWSSMLKLHRIFEKGHDLSRLHKFPPHMAPNEWISEYHRVQRGVFLLLTTNNSVKNRLLNTSANNNERSEIDDQSTCESAKVIRNRENFVIPASLHKHITNYSNSTVKAGDWTERTIIDATRGDWLSLVKRSLSTQFEPHWRFRQTPISVFPNIFAYFAA